MEEFMLPNNFDEYRAPYLEKETRFAVVMYGGVSLAIYINGVAQELFHMVRATAREVDNETRYIYGWGKLSDAEKVYRKLAETLKTKFVVDILSGTSAGGINAVFLAKALANKQTLQGIKKMWVDEGDIGVLLNDGRSTEGVELSLPRSRTSLLNSHRMYYKLLAALKSMDVPSTDDEPALIDGRSPFVNELDLYITATDIRGLNMPIKIKNAVVNEMRYKSVFHFRYATEEVSGDIDGISPSKKGANFNQFEKRFDPILAFAARCTSSIPPAFEPVQLADIKEILQTREFRDYTLKGSDPDNNDELGQFRSFFGDYPEEEFKNHFFGDGGYLDNKPFSYATETLLRRRADLPIDRKLIYIEPSPEHPEQSNGQQKKRPNAVENLAAALVNLPRQETIREDLKLIAERNEVIRNINQVTAAAAYKLPVHLHNKRMLEEPEWSHSRSWSLQYLTDDDFISWYGSAYIAYNQLRVEDVVGNLASSFSRAIGWGEGSEQELQVQKMFKEWRKKKYSISREKGLLSENDILFRLDLGFRMRKFNFIQSIVNTLLLNVDALVNRGIAGEMPDSIRSLFEANGIIFSLAPEDREVFVLELRKIKERLNEIYAYLRACGRTLRSRGLMNSKDLPDDLTAYADALIKIKSMVENKIMAGSEDLIEEATLALASHFQPDKDAPQPPIMFLHRVMDVASKRADEIIDRKRWQASSKAVQVTEDLSLPDQIRKSLSYFYDNFEYYDMLVYPIQFGTVVGESDVVEVIRVSPEEAKGIWDEGQKKIKKLAGTKLFNFSAFFSRDWRENDILWGRLDAAEILFKEVLKTDCDEEDDPCIPERLSKLKEELYADARIPKMEPREIAFNSILNEDFRPKLDTAMYRIMSDKNNLLIQASKAMNFMNIGGKKDKTKSLQSTLEKLSDGITTMVEGVNLIKYFQDHYDVERRFPDETIDVASRSAQVLGKVVDGLAEDYPALGPLKGVINNILQFAGWLLLASKKITIANVAAGLFYASSILLMLAGIFLPGFTDSLIVGIIAFLLTILAHTSALKVHNGLVGGIPSSKVGGIFADILSFLWMLVVIFFWVGLVFMVYVGFIHLGAPIPKNIIGDWIQAFIGVIKTW
jgi:patatin-related protein